MDTFELNEAQKSRLIAKVKEYMADELDQEIGSFEAEFLLDFIASAIAPAIYNRGLADARQLLLEKTEELGYQIEELEKAET